jgi:hypothetical protein
MPRYLVAFLALVLACAQSPFTARASTIVGTAERSIVQVGETFAVTFVGDAEGIPSADCWATITFDGLLAEPLSVEETAFPGWAAGSGPGHGIYPDWPGIVKIFEQSSMDYVNPPAGTTTSVVTLRALAPGELVIALRGSAAEVGNFYTEFWNPYLTYEPVRIQIVPEPSIAALFALGLAAIARQRRARGVSVTDPGAPS